MPAKNVRQTIMHWYTALTVLTRLMYDRPKYFKNGTLSSKAVVKKCITVLDFHTGSEKLNLLKGLRKRFFELLGSGFKVENGPLWISICSTARTECLAQLSTSIVWKYCSCDYFHGLRSKDHNHIYTYCYVNFCFNFQAAKGLRNKYYSTAERTVKLQSLAHTAVSVGQNVHQAIAKCDLASSSEWSCI